MGYLTGAVRQYTVGYPSDSLASCNFWYTAEPLAVFALFDSV